MCRLHACLTAQAVLSSLAGTHAESALRRGDHGRLAIRVVPELAIPLPRGSLVECWKQQAPIYQKLCRAVQEHEFLAPKYGWDRISRLLSSNLSQNHERSDAVSAGGTPQSRASDRRECHQDVADSFLHAAEWLRHINST